MKIDISKEQLENLVKLVYLGNWLANSWRDEDKIENFDDIQNVILTFAAENGLERFVDFAGEGHERAAVPSPVLEEEMEEIINFYNDSTFWDQLIFRLADRDYIRKYGEEALAELYTDEGIEKEKPFVEKYIKEFFDHGLDRLELRRDN